MNQERIAPGMDGPSARLPREPLRTISPAAGPGAGEGPEPGASLDPRDDAVGDADESREPGGGEPAARGPGTGPTGLLEPPAESPPGERPASPVAPSAAGAPSARVRPARATAATDDKLLPWLRENFEAVVVAFVMALVIRCFCVEVFKIPTGSMQPTLMGHAVTGDRIMVNKFLLHFVDVSRYDVIVFRYPLDSSRNFVKRVVGIGPETLKLKDGDVYSRTPDAIRFRLAKKPLEVQEAIWIPAYDSQFDQEHLLSHWTVSDDEAWRLTGQDLRLDAARADGGEVRLHYNRHISDYYRENVGEKGGSHWVGDVKLSAVFSIESGTGGVLFHLYNEPYAFTVRLSVGGGSVLGYDNLHAASETQRVPIKDVSLERNRLYKAAVMAFDGTLYVTLDDVPVLRFDYVDEEDLATSASFEKRIAFGVKDAAVKVSQLSIHRDLYYYSDRTNVLAEGNTVDIPAGSYFMIGDNCPNSKDSRAWKRKWVRLTSGAILEGDHDGESDRSNFSHETDGLRKIKDMHGVVHHVPEDAIVAEGADYHRFVREQELVGKALLVWWPLKRAKRIR